MLKKYLRVITCCLLVCGMYIISVAAASDHVHYTRPSSLTMTAHPHSETFFCEQCGHDITCNIVYANCSRCKLGSSEAKETKTETFLFLYLDGDAGIGVPVPAPIPCSVTYTNVNKTSQTGDTFVPQFYIFKSILTASANPAHYYPDLFCGAPSQLKFYKGQNLITTIEHTNGLTTSTTSLPFLTDSIALPLRETPTRVVTGDAVFFMVGVGESYTLSLEMQF